MNKLAVIAGMTQRLTTTSGNICLKKKQGVAKNLKKDERIINMPPPFEELNKQIHDKLKKLFQSRRNQVLSTAEIKHLFREEYPDFNVDWVQPSDHCDNITNNGACWCALTENAIFRQIERGEYNVR